MKLIIIIKYILSNNMKGLKMIGSCIQLEAWIVSKNIFMFYNFSKSKVEELVMNKTRPIRKPEM